MPKGHAAFTPEQAVWLKTLFPKYGGAETARLLNARFGTSFTVRQVNAGARNRKAGPSPVDGRFVPGDPRSGGNAAGLVEGGKATRFKKGHKGSRTRPLWSERWDHIRNGDKKTPVLMIKVPGPSPYEAHRSKGWHAEDRWVRKAVWVWEQANGPVPKGSAVMTLDGDEGNCALANLECVPKAVLARRNAYHAPTPAPGDKDAYKATIRIAQIKEAIADHEVRTE